MKVWLRAVGAFYLLMFVAAVIVRAPARQLGPPGLLERAAAGDATAAFAVDTWVALGLEFGVLGVALLVAARAAPPAIVYLVIGIEASRAALTDVYWIVRGYDLVTHLVWIAIHVFILVTGVLVARRR